MINFNEKWGEYLQKGHYGLDIAIPSVVEYLDKEFEELTKKEGFTYSQIKLKFNMARFYSSCDFEQSRIIEGEINKLVKEYDELNKRI